MEHVIESLSGALKNWADHTVPVKRGDRVFLSRLDQTQEHVGVDDLFFDNRDLEQVDQTQTMPIKLLRNQRIVADRLRNSFFPEVLRRHTKIENIELIYQTKGGFSYEVDQSVKGEEPGRMMQGMIDSPMEEEAVSTPVRFSLETDLAQHKRMFWRLKALTDGAEVVDATWTAVSPIASEARMVVVLRTFGRTSDIRSLLQSFEKQSEQSEYYRRILKNIFFFVLDTSSGVEAEDYGYMSEFEHVCGYAVAGANLGGGGNMSQSLYLLEDAIDPLGIDVGDLLLLDDDLRLSLESVCRHWAVTVFRKDDTIFTLPVFMKTEPTRMWEDGALWGRFLDRKMSGQRVGIAPRLLRHNWTFKDWAHLDDMARAHYPEYCTFIFFGLPYTRFKELGYPAAFFLRGDDIEYSLRHNKQAGKIYSNPNLTAWHEPAHSYGQEYMSIAHGVIINMLYGDKQRRAFGDFFYKRMVAHLSINDSLGLKVYGKILKDLNSKSCFLENNFSDHYINMLKGFKNFDAQFEYMSEELLESIDQEARQGGAVVGRYGFLYPPTEARDNVTQVLMENPHTGTYRHYLTTRQDTISACIDAAQELSSELAIFLNNYDDLAAHYMERFEAVSNKPFWDDELKAAGGISVLFDDSQSQA